MIVAIDLHQADLAELPLADDLVAGLDQVRRAAALGAHLHDPLVLAGRGQHGLPLGHVHADRLLDVNVSAGLDGRDHRQGMPVVGRGDQDDVEVLFLEHLAIIGERARSLLRSLPAGDDIGGLGQHLLVDVAQRDDLDRRDLDQPKQISTCRTSRSRSVPRVWLPGWSRRTYACLIRRTQARGRRAGLNELATIHGVVSQDVICRSRPGASVNES